MEKSWRSGYTLEQSEGDSQIGQLFYYMLACHVLRVKEMRTGATGSPVLGLFNEDFKVCYFACIFSIIHIHALYMQIRTVIADIRQEGPNFALTFFQNKDKLDLLEDGMQHALRMLHKFLSMETISR